MSYLLKKDCTHAEYYQQFVGEYELEALKKHPVLYPAILESNCPNFSGLNNPKFNLKYWDALPLSSHTASKMRETQNFVSLSDKVCLYKQAADILRTQHINSLEKV